MTSALPPKYISVVDSNYRMNQAWYTYFLDLGNGVYQPVDADLTAISALSTTGIAVRTGAGTWTTRTLTGTADKITVTNGDGVSGNPTVTIAATYVGQNTITTLGTITTGTWNGTAIINTYGGTGLASYTQGDILYYDAGTVLSKLAKNTSATRYLSNTGTNNNPAWAQVDLTNGVSGDLPLSNLAQGSALSVLGVTGNATADNASIAAGSDNQVLRRSGTSVAFGAVNLASSSAVTGTLPVVTGGTGVTTSTGSGSVVLSTSPTLVTPALGTPSSGTLTSCTGYTVANLSDGAWTAFTPGWTGFSVNPTVSAARYKLIGKTCFVILTLSAYGTSNATTHVMTGLPATAANTSYVMLTFTSDNGVQTLGGAANISGTSATILRSDGSGTWTASGAKGFQGVFFYETT
jgi:hypothetical protein